MLIRITTFFFLLQAIILFTEEAPTVKKTSKPSYAIVIQSSLTEDEEWNKVVEALSKKRGAMVITYEKNINDVITELSSIMPRYTCFIAQPQDIDAEYVKAIHQLTRKLDDDPYTDTQWGIITGRTAKDALRIASATQPRLIKKAVITAGVGIKRFDAAFAVSDGEKGNWYVKTPDETTSGKEPGKDKSGLFAKYYEQIQPDVVITSSHATENDLQMPYGEGEIVVNEDGNLVARSSPTSKGIMLKNDAHPKIFFPVGNCLIGNINRSSNSMAVAWLSSGCANMLIGYVEKTWFGKGGWGTLKQWEQNAERLSLSDAFFLNHQHLLYQIETNEGDLKGLNYDRDIVAIYGDPALDSKLKADPKQRAVVTSLQEKEGTFTYTIQIAAGTLNNDGEPIGDIFPYRLNSIKVIKGGEFAPLIMDNFILVNKFKFDDSGKCEIQFTAQKN